MSYRWCTRLTGAGKLYPEYYLYMKQGDKFLLGGKRRPNNKVHTTSRSDGYLHGDSTANLLHVYSSIHVFKNKGSQGGRRTSSLCHVLRLEPLWAIRLKRGIP